MSSYVIVSFIGGLVFLGIGFAIASFGSGPWIQCGGTRKVVLRYIVSAISLIIGVALIICALVAIDAKQTQTCTGCGEVVLNTNYCTNCGSLTHKPESVYICENCRKEIETNYCGDCGGKKVLHVPIEVSPAD